MSVENGKVCCNCKHNIRTKGLDLIECRCDFDGSWLSFVAVMTHWSRDKSESEDNNGQTM